MSKTVAVAGATGNLGGRIVSALRREGATVWALVRPTADEQKLASLEATGATVVKVDLGQADDLQAALRGADVVVSALQGLREVIVGTQTALLNAAVTAGAKRFIPSDYAADFTKTADEPNRNFDMRRDFAAVADQAPIEVVSVLNGMFMDLLAYGMPLFDLKNSSVTHWGDPDQLLDFTTMDDTATVTAQAALAPNPGRYVRVAGDQLSPRQLADLGTEMTGTPFKLITAGTIADLGGIIEQARAADPGAEAQEFPRFQQLQYLRNMFSGKAKLAPVDNPAYGGVAWTKVRDLVAGMLAKNPKP